MNNKDENNARYMESVWDDVEELGHRIKELENDFGMLKGEVQDKQRFAMALKAMKNSIAQMSDITSKWY